jgi:hypothetical protein
LNRDVPQTGRQPASLSPAQIRDALRHAHALDQRDPFASDPNNDVRTLGRLALRRDDVNDLFALGDLCARLSLTEDNRLLVFYAGKTLIAYRKAQEEATSNLDRDRARHAVDDYLAWLVFMAKTYPARRNVAVALWALAEAENRADAADITENRYEIGSDDHVIRDLLEVYRGADSRTDFTSHTIAYGDTGVFQS